MARRNNNKMTRQIKMEPAVQSIAFSMPAGTRYVDLSQAASLANRRFYRQGLNWAVSGIRFMQSTPQSAGTATTISVYKLPNTWVMSNSWHKAFAAWSKMNREALQESESVRPRFLDFKVFADASHHLLGKQFNLMPIADEGVLTSIADPGEWEMSKMIIPVGASSPGVTADREIVAVGGNYPGIGHSGFDAVSLIDGYSASRGLPNVLDPNTPTDADDVSGFNPDNWIAATFNEGTDQTEDVLEDMVSENNTAPYPFENGPDQNNPLVPYADTQYPGGPNQLNGLELVDRGFFNDSTTQNKIYLSGSNFPCGLIKIVSAAGAPITMIIDLVPGPHRGYLCQSMQDM
ncbi:MAG: hypothetical protein [Circular genetic element sp.]|nr:MAG: hypothetical protein [Circular genetic element sp.]